MKNLLSSFYTIVCALFAFGKEQQKYLNPRLILGLESMILILFSYKNLKKKSH